MDEYNSGNIHKDNKNNNSEKENKNMIDNSLLNTNKDLGESVMNLTQCFICLSPAINPLSCPKCNNFACEKCFETYFSLDNNKKSCPLCKQMIYLSELKPSRFIEEIRIILNKEEKKSIKIKKLSKLFKEKKAIWANKESYINKLIDKMVKYQEDLKEYKKQYITFIESWRNKILKKFQKYEDEIDNLLIALETYKESEKAKQSDEKESKENENIKTKDEKIKSLINEIISLERKYFNNKNNTIIMDDFNTDIVKDIKKCLANPFLLKPIIYTYNVATVNFEKKYFSKKTVKKNGIDEHIGIFEIKYKFKYDGLYHSLCQLSFVSSSNATYLIIQRKILDDNTKIIIPMTLVNSENNSVKYEAEVYFDEFQKEKILSIKMETIIQIVTLDNFEGY